MPVFRSPEGQSASKLDPQPFANEKALQAWFEESLEVVLDVRFVATEFSTGGKHGGRIDTLGLDEAGNPVIIEYKWDKSESVINQGLFYLDWLVDHRGDFLIAAQKALGTDVEVSWSEPRLVIVAGSYSKYDSYAVNQLPRSIELLRYARYGEGVVVVEAVSESLTTTVASKLIAVPKIPKSGVSPQYGLDFHTSKTTAAAKEAFLQIRERILALDGVEERANQKSLISYRTTRSFSGFAFLTKLVRVQFKGPEKLPEGLDPEGRVTDIRRFRWGYQWSCDLRGPEDLEYVFGLVKSAYDFEQ